MVSRTGLTSDRYIAARLSAQLGMIMQRDGMGKMLVDLVKTGKSIPVATKELDLSTKYGPVGYSPTICLSGARKALSGHKKSFGIDSYEGLLPDEERREIYLRGLVTRGNELLENGRGIHGLDEETRKANSAAAGKRSKELRRGVHGLTEEQNKTNWRLAAEARGVTMWSTDERAEANMLSKTPEYMRGNLINCRKLADYLNDKYHSGKEVRNALTVSQALRMDRYKARKQGL